MADPIQKKRKKESWDEIDPESGDVVEDIPGLQYPAELDTAETAVMAGLSGGTVPLLKAAGKKASTQMGQTAVSSVLDRIKQQGPPGQKQGAPVDLGSLSKEAQHAARANPEMLQAIAQNRLLAESALKEASKESRHAGQTLKDIKERIKPAGSLNAKSEASAVDYSKLKEEAGAHPPDLGEYWKRPSKVRKPDFPTYKK